MQLPASQYKIVLGSASPRRKQLMEGAGFTVEVRTQAVDESYPDTMDPLKVPEYLALVKAAGFLESLRPDECLVTADTIVYIKGCIVGKPADREDAIAMLESLSGNRHRVITGVCLTTTDKQRSFSVHSDVSFRPLSHEEIVYYVDHYAPYDKAGAYGIQEWIGYVGIERIEGSFYNVMGLPIQRLYEELKAF